MSQRVYIYIYIYSIKMLVNYYVANLCIQSIHICILYTVYIYEVKLYDLLSIYIVINYSLRKSFTVYNDG